MVAKEDNFKKTHQPRNLNLTTNLIKILKGKDSNGARIQMIKIATVISHVKMEQQRMSFIRQRQKAWKTKQTSIQIAKSIHHGKQNKSRNPLFKLSKERK